MGLQSLRGTDTTNLTNPDPFDEILRELDAQAGTKATVTAESRRYGKAVTLVAGLEERADLQDLLKLLKQKLATGGCAKDGRIELQGDHRRRVTDILASVGIEASP